MDGLWVLRLKDEAKEEWMSGEFYFDDSDEGDCFLTQDLNSATVGNKEKTIEEMKKHEKLIFEKFGKEAVCNFGYTNMMKNFEFVEVEVYEV